VKSSLYVFEAATWVKTCIWKNHVWKPEKKIKYGNKRNVYI